MRPHRVAWFGRRSRLVLTTLSNRQDSDHRKGRPTIAKHYEDLNATLPQQAARTYISDGSVMTIADRAGWNRDHSSAGVRSNRERCLRNVFYNLSSDSLLKNRIVFFYGAFPPAAVGYLEAVSSFAVRGVLALRLVLKWTKKVLGERLFAPMMRRYELLAMWVSQSRRVLVLQ